MLLLRFQVVYEMIFKIPSVLVIGEVRAFSTGLRKFVSYLDHGILKFNTNTYICRYIFIYIFLYCGGGGRYCSFC